MGCLLAAVSLGASHGINRFVDTPLPRFVVTTCAADSSPADFRLFGPLFAGCVRDRLSLVPTRAGYLLADEQSGRVLEKLEQTVNRGSTLFVYPCVTSLYPLLDVINPAPYVYRQPGMRNARDEART